MTRKKPRNLKNPGYVQLTQSGWLRCIVFAAGKAFVVSVKRKVSVHTTAPAWRKQPFWFLNRQRPNTKIGLIFGSTLTKRERNFPMKSTKLWKRSKKWK